MIVVSRDNVQAFSEISGIITMFYVVRTLSPYTEYEFYVIAVNNIGRGPPSLPATTTTGETVESQIELRYTHHKRVSATTIWQDLTALVAAPTVYEQEEPKRTLAFLPFD
ncbi:AGAP010092-PA [Anopheles gambiae str. PEST]|uniref:AGAP010092-PA n=1 Tax=Anopheles gambiae TaxID=7165 RepID=A0NG10_ANOGA|nr:AGAP010092-PA [Anopheles gambiae str. PEST]